MKKKKTMKDCKKRGAGTFTYDSVLRKYDS